MSTIGLGKTDIPGVTADQITDQWIAIVQDIVDRRGLEQPRAHGELQIAVKSLNEGNAWGPLMLETSQMHFASKADRDTVLAKILGERIPLLPPKSP
jgi:hypothetical protein